jgi:UDP-glucose:(heptosyl)LPS alpha-1,3-glucosyltransferase
MQMQAQALGARVHFLGALPDVADAYRAATLLVHPTLEDTYAMVVLEAMSHGLPVVVSGARWCGIAAELQDGVNAVLLDDPQDVAGLLDRLNAILGNILLYEVLSSASVRFSQRYSWSEAARQYEDLMKGEERVA